MSTAASGPPGASFATRQERLREIARYMGLDGALVFSWRRQAVAWFTGYVPGFLTNWACLWLPVTGRPVLKVRFDFDRERAAHGSSLAISAGDDPIDVLPDGVRRIGISAGDFAIDELPSGLSERLRSRNIECTDLRDATDEWRRPKDGWEQAQLVKATHVAAIAVEAVGTTAPRGDSDFEIAGRVECRARQLGASRCLCLVGIGPSRVVTEATGIPVQNGDSVSLEVSLTVEGGSAQVAVTLPAAGSAASKALAVCHDVRDRLKDAMGAGTPVARAVATGDHRLHEYGLLAAKLYDFGHGIGWDIPERPRLVAEESRSFEHGEIVALHVGVRDGHAGAAFVGGPVVIDNHKARELINDAPWHDRH